MISVLGVLTDKVSVCGWPWHGRIDKPDEFSPAVVHLPNGTTRPHELPEMAGYTYRVKVPGVAPITRSPDQVVADMAAGMAWRNEAILCGRYFQLYGKDLQGWVYCAADGSRWIINLAAETATLLGAAGKPSMVKSIAISWPADDGQSTPAIAIPDLVVKRAEMPVDIRADGGQAILMLYFSDPAYDIDARKIPLGFLRLDLTGSVADPFAAAVTVLRTRAQTLGSMTYVDDMTVTTDHFGNPNSGTGTETRDITDRIWAMWFDASGAVQECAVDKHSEDQQEIPLGSTAAYQRARISWTLKLAGTPVVVVDLQSEANNVSPTEYSTIGTLNSDQIFNQTNLGNLAPYAKGGPFTPDAQVMTRNNMGSVNAGDFFDIHAYSNNLIGFYVRLVGTGSTHPEHHYFGAASPGGAVTVSHVESAELVSGPPQNKLYGPKPYGAYNPVTSEVIAPVAAPLGWT